MFKRVVRGTITKKYTTETAHIVRNASSERCRYSLHGHSYSWHVSIEGPIGENGMVIDFKDLAYIKGVVDLFDHATVLWDKEDKEFKNFFLNTFRRVLIMKKNTTAECMARLIFQATKEWLNELDVKDYNVVKVDVWETATGCASAVISDSDDILTYTHTDRSL